MSIESSLVRGFFISGKDFMHDHFGLQPETSKLIAVLFGLLVACLVWWFRVGSKSSAIPKAEKLGANFIQAAIDGNQSGLLELLDKWNVNVNHQDATGATALMYAVANVKNDIVKLLMDHGADPLIKNAAGKTAADYAIKYNNPAAIVILEQ